MSKTRILKKGASVLQNEGLVYFTKASYRYLLSKLRMSEYKLRWGRSCPPEHSLIHINPQKVSYLQVPFFMNYLNNDRGHYIKKGSWDSEVVHGSDFAVRTQDMYTHAPKLREIGDYIFFQSLKKHFNDGVPWTETSLWDTIVTEKNWRDKRYFDSGKISEDKTLQRLENIDRLYKSIKENGYISQRKIKEKDRQSEYWVNKGHGQQHEVVVNIGRKGQIIFEEGKHRFIIARILGLEKIPVTVFVRHTEWQNIRHKLMTKKNGSDLNEISSKYSNHPDINNWLC